MDDYSKPYIPKPKPPRTPRINGPKVFSVRPGSPFAFTIPATGDHPMRFAARSLPEGLVRDETTGRITGKLDEPGEHTVTLVPENALGSAKRPFRIVVGEAIALTPPMSWNHWNCWAADIENAKTRAAAKAMVDTGLMNHGWVYISIEDDWQTLGLTGPNTSATSGARRTSARSKTPSPPRSAPTASYSSE